MGEKTGNLNKSATSADCLISSLNKPIEIALRNILAKTYDIKNIQNIVKEIKVLKNEINILEEKSIWQRYGF